MSRLTERYASIGVHNDVQFMGDNIVISYTGQSDRRAMQSACWIVTDGKRETNLNAAWYENGHKTFYVRRQRDETFATAKRRALDEAKDWCAERYGITEWARTPFGGWADKSVVEARVKLLDAQVVEQGERRSTAKANAGLGYKAFWLTSVRRPKEAQGRQIRLLVATKSKKRAAEIFDVTTYYLNNFGGETANDHDQEVALAQPETLFWSELNHHDREWKVWER